MKFFRRSSPIFRKILIPMSLLVIFEIALLIGGLFLGGVTTYLDQNERDILHERGINRKTYLENEMVNSWANVGTAVSAINQKAQALLESGAISLDTLDDGSDPCAPLILATVDDLIAMMRSNRVTGAFMIFNTADLSQKNAPALTQNKPGIYLRDFDPIPNSSSYNLDLLIERAPVSVVQQMNISTDSAWRPQFEFSHDASSYPDYFYAPFQKAFERTDSEMGFQDFGYWSLAHHLYEDSTDVISYSVPLMLEDGTLYGVLGVDITLDHLCKALPYSEISDDRRGSYLLVVDQDDEALGDVDNVLINGPVYRQAAGPTQTTTLRSDETQVWIETDSGNFICTVEYLSIYNTNAPFSNQRWALIGTVRDRDLFSFSNRISNMLLTGILFTMLVGALGSFIASRFISRPVTELAREMNQQHPKTAIVLSRTGILEIDQLADAIETLSRDVIDSATKLTQIMEMASVRIAGFELRRDEDSLFITDGFFDIFHLFGIDTRILSARDFHALMDSLDPYYQRRDSMPDAYLYKIPAPDGVAYVRLACADDGVRCIGLAEDVTRATLELDMIEHERDHDLLTGLINRRAFHRQMAQLFEQGDDTLKTAALVMMDLDNLKRLNDLYGHDCGDKYIRATAESFLESAPNTTIISRISGDEFYLFFYGYNSRKEILALLARLKLGIAKKLFLLPTQEPFGISVSGGVAWYPSDSRSLDELSRFSDFAMYKAKQSRKGELEHFDLHVYQRENYLLQNKAELTELIEKERIEYHFQPIVCARTGKIYAYEALMRANMPALHTPDEIITLARLESKLSQIETLTWFKAMEAFADLCQRGQIAPSCRVFINSMANQIMSASKFRAFEVRFGEFLSRIVLEFTEEERADEAMLLQKRHQMEKWHAALALDDYGSGYNSGKMLLSLSPKFIKVDLSIIRGIDQNSDKQKLVQNIVSYAHERDMLVVAEGIETVPEAETVIRTGADFLQGYFLARPASKPPTISEAALSLIDRLSREMRGEIE